MPYFIKFWKSFGPPPKTALVSDQKEMGYVDLDDSQEDVRFSYLHPNFDKKLEEFSKEKDIEVLKKRLSYWLGTYWLQFDDAYIKPKLICNWPEVKKEHDEIAEVITGVIKKYLDEKKKMKMYLTDKEKNGESDLKEKLVDNEEDEHNEYKTTYSRLQDDENNNAKMAHDRKISRDELMHK